jgi:hypothetical protein
MKRTILAVGHAKAGETTYRVETSTPTDTPILLLSGAGVLYGVDCSSGATTSYAMAFDSAASAGITVTTLGKAITPQVYSAGTSFVANAGWRAGYGNESVAFFNGLVALTHGGTINCLFRVGPSNGSYP